ncbi:MAG TPA: ABC transporter substrate-binding protein, partial [Thermomicrobiaceae bacterium]|nr:ABC transporter substrate-binding protein [Thermomicrobiaceae bacterium]
DKAARLLDEAGAKRNGGTRELNGRPLKWVYQTTVNQVRQKTQEVIKASLQKLNISVELKTIESSVFFSGDAGNTDTDSHFYADLEMYTNTPANLFPISWYQRYYSPEIAQKENDWHGTNYLRYANPDFDKLFEQVRTEIDPRQSTETFLQMQRLIWQDVAEIAIVARKNVSAAGKELAGYTPSSWYGDTADIADWRKG